MPSTVILILSAIFTIAAVVLLYIFVVPKKRRSKLNKFGRFLHDLLNFNFLTLEIIFKFFYVLATAFVIILGFFMIFWVEANYQYHYGYSTPYYVSYAWLGYWGLAVIICGPILVRIIYEATMMIIIAINNIIQINKKIPDKTKENVEDANISDEIHMKTGEKNDINFCASCGTSLEENHVCLNCMRRY